MNPREIRYNIWYGEHGPEIHYAWDSCKEFPCCGGRACGLTLEELIYNLVGHDDIGAVVKTISKHIIELEKEVKRLDYKTMDLEERLGRSEMGNDW